MEDRGMTSTHFEWHLHLYTLLYVSEIELLPTNQIN